METEPVLQIEAYGALMLLCTDGTDQDELPIARSA